MTASARILIDTIADVVVIPLAAVQEDKEGKFVQLYERGSLRRQAIITGKSDAINTEIKE
jgi:multidrug efflux pump subunit AcrA (membrane-fusion protein)